VSGYPPVAVGGHNINITPNHKWVDISVQ